MSLSQKSCCPQRPGTPGLSVDELRAGLEELHPDWSETAGWLVREFRFKGYPATIKFVNAVASIAEDQDHHPVLEVDYGRVVVRYRTHSIDALSENDLICAARIDLTARSE